MAKISKAGEALIERDLVPREVDAVLRHEPHAEEERDPMTEERPSEADAGSRVGSKGADHAGTTRGRRGP